MQRSPARHTPPQRARPGMFVRAAGPRPEPVLEASTRMGVAWASRAPEGKGLVGGKGLGFGAREHQASQQFSVSEPGASCLPPTSLDCGSFSCQLVGGRHLRLLMVLATLRLSEIPGRWKSTRRLPCTCDDVTTLTGSLLSFRVEVSLIRGHVLWCWDCLLSQVPGGPQVLLLRPGCTRETGPPGEGPL